MLDVGSVTVVVLLATVPGVMLVVKVVRELMSTTLATDADGKDEEVGFARQEQADEREDGELPHLSINVGTSVGAVLMVVVNVAQKTCAAAVDLSICRMQLFLL